jgi:PAS domain S-box-containing protein
VRGETATAVTAQTDSDWPRALLDALPTALVLVEPGTGRLLFANRAARAMGGGSLTLDKSGDGPMRLLVDGRPLEVDELPRHAEWETPAGVRAVEIDAERVVQPDGGEVIVVTFADTTEAESASRREQYAGDELRAILEGVADSVTAQAPDGSLVYANAAAVRLLGYPSAEALIAAPLRELMSRWEMYTPEGDPFPVERLPGRRALAGEQPEPELVRYVDRVGGDVRWARVKAEPVKGPDGSVRLAINLIEDITELKQAELSQRLLAEASRVLAGSLEYEQTLATIADLAVPDIADWCGVDLAVDGAIQRVAVAHVDPAKVAMAEELADRYPVDMRALTGTPNVLRTGVPELYHDIPHELLVAAARDEEHLELIRSLGMVSAMVVPMRVRERVLGAITFVSAESGRRFTEWDLQLAEDLGLRAGTAVENARLYRARSTIARTLQASLLPPHLPEIPDLDLGAVYQAAGEGYEVGGDFYDVFDTAEDQWYAVIGDVCGKGAEAAAVTALARYTLRAAATRRYSPAGILRLVNDGMLRQAATRFCTIALAHIDRSGGATKVTVAAGGHPLPVVLRAGGDVDTIGVAGTLLGLVEDPTLADAETELAPGDTLMLYTDGVTEAGAPVHVWTPEELEDAVRGAAGGSAQDVVDHLVDAATSALEAAPRDDIAVLALRRSP